MMMCGFKKRCNHSRKKRLAAKDEIGKFGRKTKKAIKCVNNVDSRLHQAKNEQTNSFDCSQVEKRNPKYTRIVCVHQRRVSRVREREISPTNDHNKTRLLYRQESVGTRKPKKTKIKMAEENKFSTRNIQVWNFASPIPLKQIKYSSGMHIQNSPKYLPAFLPPFCRSPLIRD